MDLLRIPSFIVGLAVVVGTLYSIIETFILPRSANDPLTRVVFLTMRRIFDIRANRAQSYEERDRVMAFYAPVSLLMLPPVWLALILVGYMGMFWALGENSWRDAFRVSGSSLLTLGFATLDDIPKTALAFSEAALGLILVALLIAYLPTIYSAFQRREVAVTLLEVRAGSPPEAVEMLERFHRIHGLERLGDQWSSWELWFADIQESHTSIAAVVFFRSPQPGHSWITAAGAVLDAAAITASTLDIPRDPRADLCIRAGYLALRHIADFFRIPYNANPKPDDPISITHQEYDAVYDRLVSKGIPLKQDREQAWRDFAGWRVNYDTPLLALCAITMAPYAPWSSDRSMRRVAPSQ
jgi:nitrogen fixation-related uncharacterized protein